MKSSLYSLVNNGVLFKAKKIIVTYATMIRPTNTDTSVPYIQLFGLVSNDDPPIELSSARYLCHSSDTDYPYRSITMDIDPEKEITSVFFVISNDDNDHNTNTLITRGEIVMEEGLFPVGISLCFPVATDATNITSTSFSANWSAVTGATGYRLDVSDDIDFETFVTGFENLDVSNVVTYSVTGLTANTCYFYRVRAYNTNVISLSSNTIHVPKLEGIFSGDYLVTLNSPDKSMFTGTHLLFDGLPNYLRSNLLTLGGQGKSFNFKYNKFGLDFALLHRIIYSYESTSIYETLHVEPTGNFLIYGKAMTGGANTIVTWSNLPYDDAWHSISVVFDLTNATPKDRIKMYCDGILVPVNTSTSYDSGIPHVSTTYKYRFFGQAYSTYEFIGGVKHIVITSDQLDATGIANFANHGTGLYSIENIPNKTMWAKGDDLPLYTAPNYLIKNYAE